MAKDTSKSGGASASDTSSRAADQDRASKDLTRVHVWQIQAVRDVMFVAVIVLIIWLGYLLSAVTVPLLVGLLLAYLFEPLVARISAHPKIRRPVAVVMILGVGTIVLAAVAAIAIPIIVGQTDRLAGDIREGRLAQQFARVDSYIPEAWRDDYRSFVGVLPGGDRAIDTLVDTEAPTEDIVEPVEADEVPATQSADGEATADDPVEPTVSVDETAEIVVPTTAIDPADMTAEEFRAFVDGAVAEKIAERESEIAALSKDDDGGGGSVFAFARGGAEAVWRFVGAAIHIGFLAVLIPYFFFFFSMWFPSISEFVRSCIPEKRKDRTLEL
ncbi:MAG: AI-2E family transporter, partial [Planctomycetota bacterium]